MKLPLCPMAQFSQGGPRHGVGGVRHLGQIMPHGGEIPATQQGAAFSSDSSEWHSRVAIVTFLATTRQVLSHA